MAEERPATATTDVDGAGDIPRVARILTQVVAPATLVTGLLYFFGRSHATYFLQYLGVDVTVLQLTTQDYLLRSQDGLLVPLLVISVGVLVLLWTWSVVPERVRGSVDGHRQRVAATVVGAVLVVVGVLRALGVVLLPDAWSWVAPACLALGVVVLSVAVVAHRRAADVQVRVGTRLTEWGAVFVLVALALFWAVADYSAAVGTQRARQFVAELPGAAGVVVRSAGDLGLVTTGAAASCPEGAALPYRSTGYVLLTRSGGYYVLVPRTWEHGDPVPLVAAGPEVRLDFVAAGADVVDPGC
ncbi:hypothetical protein [Cellulosimicrobium cellulans]|uniref:hypothetical protein n=1 Tax=Cellulosimicrobium cellulans TaxID=1710 RepID=UPI002405E9D6|nr:hypothetical protein [Cellulosimicrobium cellulans]MDF9877262.1 protein-S-isoprenylcysteine O-methyltransferase Ste14 [Cellulosimicrobium cellulans]